MPASTSFYIVTLEATDASGHLCMSGATTDAEDYANAYLDALEMVSAFRAEGYLFLPSKVQSCFWGHIPRTQLRLRIAVEAVMEVAS